MNLFRNSNIVVCLKQSVAVFGMLVLALGVGQARSQPTAKTKVVESEKMLIEPEGLQKILQDDNLRILDARSEKAFSSGRIPGAVLVDVAGWKELAASERGFHKAKEWGAIIGRLGIDKNSEIVVYGDSLSNTARVWWLLKYAGLKDVKILNGGWALWMKEKRPTSTKSGAVRRTEFKPKFQADRLEEIDTLKKSVKTGKVKVVDTRSDGEFIGKIKRGKRGGHIPGATHLEWKELVAQDGRFKSPSQLRKLFESRGLKPNQTMVCY